MILRILCQTVFLCLFSLSALAEGIADFQLPQPRAVKDVKFVDDQGSINTLNDFRGKVILLTFWATWCVPCVEEMPSIAKLQASLEGRNIKIIPLSVDYQGSKIVADFYKEQQITNLPIYQDRKGESFKLYELRALPTSLIINKEGKEVARVMGAIDWSGKDVRDYLVALSRM